jgi:CheY-like chemotaxis protein
MRSGSVPPAEILLVDNNPNGLTARKIILEGEGFHVTTVTTAEDAWEVFHQKRFDIVVTDYKLNGVTGMTGGELIRLIRAADSPCRVILLSGFIGALGLTEENTGADELILKSNKEVAELTRAARKLAHQGPRRRSVGSATGRARRLVVRKPAGER